MNPMLAKVIGNGMVWLAFTIVCVATLVNAHNLDGGPIILIMILLTGGAVTATQHIWKSGSVEAEAAEKSKRQGKLDRVLERLSDDEIADLRQRLMAGSDGEQVSLDDLMRL